MNPASFPETADIETSSPEYADRFSGEAGQFFLSEQTRITLQLLECCQSKKVLDVGGAHCQLALPLVEKGYDLTITGSDPVCGQLAAERLPAGSFSYLTCNSLGTSLADRSFPVVLSFRLVPHASNWPALLSELCRVSAEMVIIDYLDIRSFNLLLPSAFSSQKEDGRQHQNIQHVQAQADSRCLCRAWTAAHQLPAAVFLAHGGTQAATECSPFRPALNDRHVPLA